MKRDKYRKEDQKMGEIKKGRQKRKQVEDKIEVAINEM